MLLASCTTGLEDIAMLELQKRFKLKAKKAYRGLLEISAKPKAVFKLNYCSKTLNKIMLCLLSGDFETLDELYNSVRETSFAEFIQAEQSFAVRVSRAGKHNFTSIDAASVIGKAVIDSYKAETNVRLKVDLDEPDVVVKCYIRDNRFWLGIDTTAESLHKRGYRIYQHPAPLRPTIASSMVMLSEWKPKESLYDPFCGSGTIPIEAGLLANNIPNWWRWQSFALWKLKFLPLEKFLKEKERIDASIKHKKLKLYGSDLFAKHIEGAKRNASNAGVEANFFVKDAKQASFDYDVIVTNPPYGKRIGRPSKALFANRIIEEKFFTSGARKAVVITAEPKGLKSYARKRFVMYGDLAAWIFIYEK